MSIGTKINFYVCQKGVKKNNEHSNEEREKLL